MRQFYQRCRRVGIFLTAVVACIAASGYAQDAPKQQAVPFTLLVAPEQASVKAGSAVWIVVTKENKSDHTIFSYRVNSDDTDQGGWIYKVQVQDVKGVRASKTQFGRDIQGRETPEEKEDPPGGSVTISGGYVRLAPGKTMIDRINVSKIYDLSHPGKYTIKVRTVDEETHTFVESNSITVTVSP